MAKNDPSTRSADSFAMQAKCRKIHDILGGAETMRRAGAAYLPRFAAEDDRTYEMRLKTAPFVNIFGDIVENLGDRPFRKPLHINEATASPAILELCRDVDGEGNSLHSFAQEVFFNGLNFGADFILIDFTRLPEWAKSIEDQKKLGARPYFQRVCISDLLAARTAYIDGKEKFTHVRIAKSEVREDGYDEKTVDQILVLDRAKLDDGGYAPATWTVFEKQERRGANGSEWVAVDSGTYGLADIPLVCFMAGRRRGRSFNFDLPMEDAAQLQIEHFQAETNLKVIKTLACFPMLAGEGIEPPKEQKPIVFGPGSVLFSPPNGDGKHGKWSFVEPAASSLKLLADEVERTERQLREIGRQPLTANSGNLTVVTTAFAAAKGNSAVESWALALKDTLEQALGYFALWLSDKSKPEVAINVDLSADMTGADFSSIIAMRKNGDISRERYWEEAKRRGILSADFSADDEKERLMIESPDPDTEDEIEAAAAPRRVLPFNR